VRDGLKDLAILFWLISDVLGELDGIDDGGQQESAEGNNEGVDGNTVVFVLFVWVRASQAQPGQEGPEEVKEEADDDQSCCAADIAWRTERELEHLADCCCC
jgi:hypothetical protein